MIKQKFMSTFKKFKELQGSPTYLARGVVIGVFVGFAPLMPFKSAIILTTTVLLSCSTVAALLSCTIICNPLTYIPLYYIAWVIGDFLLPGKASWILLEQTITQMQQSSISEAIALAADVGLETIIVVLAGGCVLALPFAFFSYPIAHHLFQKMSRKQIN